MNEDRGKIVLTHAQVRDGHKVVITSVRAANFLIFHGNPMIGVGDSYNNPQRKVFFFWDTKKLRKTIEIYNNGNGDMV